MGGFVSKRTKSQVKKKRHQQSHVLRPFALKENWFNPKMDYEIEARKSCENNILPSNIFSE